MCPLSSLLRKTMTSRAQTKSLYPAMQCLLALRSGPTFCPLQWALINGILPHSSLLLRQLLRLVGCARLTTTNNICSNDDGVGLYFSNVTGNGYLLTVPSADPSVTPPALMNDIITNEWSTFEAVFDGAFNDTVAGGHGQSPNSFTNNTMDLSCSSQLPMCSCLSPRPVAPIDGACPITTCGECN